MHKCKYCQEERKSQKSVIAHEVYCKSNPNAKVSHRKGVVVSEETRKKISENTARQHREGRGIPVCQSYDWNGRKHSKETKQKMSQSMMGNRNANHRGDRQSYHNGIRMDSSWEVKTAQYFDKNNIEYIYDEKPFVLPNGSHYYPDFFIYENGVFQKLVEVKGYFREANKKKFELFKKTYPHINIELWDKPVLQRLNIL